ncbi:molybdopterin-binding protein [Beijerinckia sp. L45]|uniref:competence/damage-inducible protein A n=1 Tax=Beijerinckia sp. L45 TaxID=1641855 RepID=UPI00131BACEC|nr:molybdopterin-binding protein [Beijerinckia sp. L45]
MTHDIVTAAVLVIGDEILSGRTKDRNIGAIAERCSELGIDLREVRIVADDEDAIVAALNALRARFTYVFTTGGIGPTHDDITADAVAKAFGVAISEDPRAIALLLQRIKPEDLNAARRRMARIPHGAALVENSVSKAPGFWIENVIVMAGVPAVMNAMLDAVTPLLAGGTQTVAQSVAAGTLPEGAYAAALGEIATDFPGLAIGSYPSFRDGAFHNEIVVRGKDAGAVGDAAARVGAMIAGLEQRR